MAPPLWLFLASCAAAQRLVPAAPLPPGAAAGPLLAAPRSWAPLPLEHLSVLPALQGAAPALRGLPALPDGLNDEGIPVWDRAGDYYRRVRAFADEHPELDLRDSLDVMDDSYGDVWAKLSAVEGLASRRRLRAHNVHLERTLTWVDAVMTEGRRNVALHTYRVYFHRAAEPRSEIEEGRRRLDRYLEEAELYFRPGGRAERALGPLQEVVLAFHTRGYPELRAHVDERAREFARRHGRRFRFEHVEDLVATPAGEEETRQELRRLVRKYRGDGLDKIIEGVIYSRYVGVLLELKTLEHYQGLGHRILQSGRELFGPDGRYVTELDAVTRSPEGATFLVEAKSARVPLPFDVVLQDKVVRKLETYRRERALLEASIGAPIDRVVFSMDPGPNAGLEPFLRGKEEELSRRFGFPVSFLFLRLTEDEDPASRVRRVPPRARLRGRRR